MAYLKVILACLLAWLAAQCIKFTIDLIQGRKPSIALFFESGGMPSSHSSFVAALAAAVFINEGASLLFLVTLVFAIIVMYDSFSVRRAVGNHAAVLNELLKSNKSLRSKYGTLDEHQGHTKLQVFLGALLGIAVAIIVCFI